MSNRRATAVLVASVLFTSLTIFGVHFQQQQERDTMYQGVLRDDVRRKEKMKQREEDLRISQEKRAIYERVQAIDKASAA